MNRIRTVGIDYAIAPVAIREKFALSESEQARFMRRLRKKYPGVEVVTLATCNRTEVYTFGEVDATPDFLALRPRVRIEPYRLSGRRAVSHLFEVASALGSMVVGETQIIGQVGTAYQAARKLGATGKVLNNLFQRARHVAGKVHSETGIARGSVSIAALAVEQAQKTIGEPGGGRILLIGAGDVAKTCLKSLRQTAPDAKIVVVNRSRGAALMLAREFGAVVAPFANLADELAAADVVFAATAAKKPLIRAKILKPAAHRKGILTIFDIAVPRNTEKRCDRLEHVRIVTIDDLESSARENRRARSIAANRAREIIENETENFLTWFKTLEAEPVIGRLVKRLHAIRNEELARSLPKLAAIGGKELAEVRYLTERIVNKILHHPLSDIKKGIGGKELIEGLVEMFDLDVADPEGKD